MTQYVDGFLLPLAREKIDEYENVATKAGAIWMEHGALAYWETISDDLGNNEGRSFMDAADATQDEVVVFAWVVYPSRADRDRILAAVMNDPRLQDNVSMPFDMKRMAHAGFQPLVVY